MGVMGFGRSFAAYPAVHPQCRLPVNQECTCRTTVNRGQRTVRQRLKGHPSHCCGGGATIDLPLAAAQQYLRGELGVYVDSVGNGDDAFLTNHEVNYVILSHKRFCA